jgi:multiple antibiotic resistance protein
VCLIMLIAVGIAACFLIFVMAGRVSRFLGSTGNVVMSRLLGLILAGLAVQFVVDGIRALIPVAA